MVLVARTRHAAARPSWDCAVCERPWPCADAKVDLGEQYARFRTGLLLHLASLLGDAAADLTRPGGTPPADLYERFLSWVTVEPARSVQAGSRGSGSV